MSKQKKNVNHINVTTLYLQTGSILIGTLAQSFEGTWQVDCSKHLGELTTDLLWMEVVLNPFSFHVIQDRFNDAGNRTNAQDFLFFFKF